MQGKRILFATLGSVGDPYSYLAVASEMQRRGHRATEDGAGAASDALESHLGGGR